MEKNYKSVIDIEEFQQKVLDYISSDKINKMIDSTVFKDKPEYKSAIIHGLLIASMLSVTCQKMYVVQQRERVTENLLFKKPFFCKENDIVNEFDLKFITGNSRTRIYENDDVRFCFDKKVIRVLLYDSNNKDLRCKIEDYFYKKK